MSKKPAPAPTPSRDYEYLKVVRTPEGYIEKSYRSWCPWEIIGLGDTIRADAPPQNLEKWRARWSAESAKRLAGEASSPSPPVSKSVTPAPALRLR